MLSFFNQHRSESKAEVDSDTDGPHAYVYRGGHSEIPKDTVRLRVDPSVRHLDGRVNYRHLFSIELPKNNISIDANLTQGTSCLPPSKIVQAMSAMISEATKSKDVFKSENLKYLRNVAFPPDLQDKNLPTFDNKSELGKVLPARRNHSLAFSFMCNGYALRNRFDGLPVHSVCYYHSYDSDDAAIQQLKMVIKDIKYNGVDCLGMTPLHVLSCSTKHRMEMYQLLIHLCPVHLFVEDKWGDIPLFYAIWGFAPREAIDLMISTTQKINRTFHVNWWKMLETLVLAQAPTSCIEYLIEISDNAVLDYSPNLHPIYWARYVDMLCTKARAPEEHVNNFISMYERLYPNNRVDLKSRAAEMIRREKFSFQLFWLKLGISSRLEVIEKQNWKQELRTMIETCPTGNTSRAHRDRIQVMETLHRKLEVYEVYGLMWLLELALWKGRMESNHDEERSHCRFTCGVDFIVPKVASYLLPET